MESQVSQVKLPPNFDIRAPNAGTEWRLWKLSFEDYLIGMGQEQASDKVKLSLLRNMLGMESTRIILTLPTSVKDACNYEKRKTASRHGKFHVGGRFGVNNLRHVASPGLRRRRSRDSRHAWRPRAPVLSQLHPQQHQQKGTPEDQGAAGKKKLLTRAPTKTTFSREEEHQGASPTEPGAPEETPQENS
ncbi:hypothetical protein ACJJTC_016506 [Scirpophaga incertulas]